jgi:DNA mismatch endonuclease, patch repair protein
MTDVFTREERSKIMSGIRGRGNKSTEGRLRALLESEGLSGWREAAEDLPGKPDFVFDDLKIALFADGCFWHGCADCRDIPASNTEFWAAKIGATKERDKRIIGALEAEGWLVLRFWEHELKRQSDACASAIYVAVWARRLGAATKASGAAVDDAVRLAVE